jgi:hypothetical protein
MAPITGRQVLRRQLLPIIGEHSQASIIFDMETKFVVVGVSDKGRWSRTEPVRVWSKIRKQAAKRAFPNAPPWTLA